MGSLNAESPPKQEMDDSGYVQEDTAAKESQMAEENKSSPNLLDLSDDVLLYILQYCSPMDLKALGFTCSRLGTLVLDRTLWQFVDARATPTGRRRMHWLLTNALRAHTTTLRLSGYAREARECLGFMNSTINEPPLQAPPLCPMADEILPLNMYDTNDQHGPRLFSVPAQALPRCPGGFSYWPEQSETRSNRQPAEPDPARMCPGPQMTLTDASLIRLTERCPNLTELALEHVVIDCNMTKVSMFPASLRILSLKGTKCFNLKKMFLYKINDHLVNLEDLNVSFCEWIEPSCMLPLSKLPKLSRLIMQYCTKLTEFVAYASLATRYGFKALKILDLRGSPVGDSEVSALGWVPLLEQLYLSPANVSRHPDHAHLSRETTVKHTELMPWEELEPEYYRDKYIAEQWIRDEAQPRLTDRQHEDDSAYKSCMLLSHAGDVDLNRTEQERPTRHEHQPPAQALPTINAGRPGLFSGSVIKPDVLRRTYNYDNPSCSTSQQNKDNSQNSKNESDGNATQKPIAKRKKWYQFMCENYESYCKNAQNNEANPLKHPQDVENNDESEAKRCKKENEQENVAMKSNCDVKCDDNNKPGCSKGQNNENMKQSHDENEVMRDKKYKNQLNKEVHKQLHSNYHYAPYHPDIVARNHKILEEYLSDMRAKFRMRLNQESVINGPIIENEVNRDNSKLTSNNEVSSSINESLVNEADSSKTEANSLNKTTSDEIKNEVTSSSEASTKDEVSCSRIDNSISNSEAGSSKSFIISNSEASTSKSEASTSKSEASTSKSEATTSKSEGPTSKSEATTSKSEASTSKTETESSSKDINSSNEANSSCDTSNKESCNIIKVPKGLYTKASRKHYDDNNGLKVEKESLSDFKKRLLSSGHKNNDSTKSPDNKDDNDDDQPQSKRCRVVDEASTSQISPSKKTGESSNPGPSDPGPSTSDPGQPQRFVRFTRNRPPVVVEGCGNHTDDNHNVHNNNDVQQPDWNNLLAESQSNNRPSSSNNSANNQPEPEPSRHKILYVNVGRRRHAMYQISMPEPVDLRTQRPLTAAMNLLYSAQSAPRLEYTSLVTDSAIRRFGRADGENINYVQIGPLGIAPAPYDDPHARPNRSNLRILSVTGFRHVTNYSLIHLATAAPHLQLVDFTGTRVTESGVEHFRNIRPDCRVRYGPVDTPKEDNGRPHSR